MIVQVDKFPGQTGRLRRADRLDQARIVIPDIADARADRPHVLVPLTPLPNRGNPKGPSNRIIQQSRDNR
jgi:hypothetical protein